MNEQIRMNSLFGIFEDHGLEYPSLDQLLVHSPHSTYFFRMEGVSMAPLVLAGDILIVDRSLRPVTEQLVLVQKHNQSEKNFLCRKIIFQKNSPQILLVAENKNFPTFPLNENDENQDITLFGVITGQVRQHVWEKN